MFHRFPKILINYSLKKKLPIFQWLPEYNLTYAASDFIAGLTVGLTLLPQSIAYAALAGLGPQYGLYSSFAGSFIYIFFGTVKEINIGPTALLSLLTFTYTNQMNPDFAVLLCFLSGVIEVFCGIFRLGFIVEFVSIPVISGFCSATAIIIASSQVKNLLGVKINSESFIETWSEITKKIPETRPWDLTLSIACCTVLLGMRKLKDVKIGQKIQPNVKKVLSLTLWMLSTARNAMVVIICAGLAYFLTEHGDPPFLLTGAIESGLPKVGLPPFTTTIGNQTYGFLDMCSHLGSGIIIVPIVALLGNMAVAKAFANGEVIDVTQEMTALGLCNIVGSLFRSMPVSGSFSRSAVGNASGIQTPLAGLYVGILILLALSFLTPYFYFIPKATLSSVIICAVIFMVEVRLIRLMWKSSKQDLIPAFISFIICLWKGVEIGILSGVAVDFIYLLYVNARPKFTVEKISSPCGQEYMIIYPSTGLLFPAVNCIRLKISKIGKNSNLPIVLDCNHIKNLDFTAIQGLKASVEDMKKSDCLLLFHKLDDKIAQHLKSYIGHDFLHCPSDAALPQFMKVKDEEALQMDIKCVKVIIIKGSQNYSVWLYGRAFQALLPRWTLRFLFSCIILILLAEVSDSAQSTRRRLRRPSSSTSITKKKGDQEISESVNRFRVKNKHSANSIATRKSSENSDEQDYKIVCYYTNWSQYRPKHGKFLPEDIQPDLCTHIIFAFGWLKKGKLSSFESNDETKDGKIGLYDRINKLKKANPNLKVLLAIGGWSFGTQKFKDMSSSRYSRQTFIYSAIPFLRDRHFDGLDMDWEYPKGSDDKKNFVLLLKELREAFEAEAQEVKKPRLLLTAAVPVGPDNIKSGYDVPAVASYLDFINLMAYDFHGKWERETGHNAPLHAPSSDSEWRKQLSVENAANTWVRLGAPKDKLVIGMPTYGRTFTLSNPKVFKVNSPASGGGKAGEYTKEGGFLAYYEICEMLQNGATYIWDDEMKVPYMVDGDQWVGFDDEKSIRHKMKWIKSNGFAGAMVWTVDMDDFTGTICGGEVKYPLIGAMREELLGISRGNNAKDVDWSKVANTVVEINEKPAPVKIPVSDVLNRYRKPTKVKVTQNAVTNNNERDPQIFCYMTSWSQKRPGAGKFTPEDVDAGLCTHVIYAFATLKNHRLSEADEKDGEMYDRVVALREKNPNLKVMLAIGGWAFGSTPFKELTSNTFRINQFVYEAIEFLREYKFNGLDVDWEYPRGADDRTAYVNLLKELRIAFEGEAKSSNQPRLLLSAAVPASFEAIAAGYDVPEISKYLDYINVMTYDFHGQWERQVGHNSPLYSLESATGYQKKLTVDFSAREWVKQGAPKEKLMIGMPTYGRSFTLVNESQFDIGAPASGGGTPGKYTGEAGFMSYYEVCDFLRKDNTTLVWDNEQQVPFAYYEDQWVGFDDERSLKTKMTWLKEEGFGGIMIWSVDMDDFRGQCGSGKYPLIKAMKSELDDYSVKLEYDGPYEDSSPNGQYTTKDPNEVICEEEDGHISYHKDKADCRMYYMCEGERKHHMPCPANLVFNPNENVCDWPENVEGCMEHTAAPPVSRRR